MANAARLGVGLGAVCADVVETLNAILKRAHNDHTAGGGGAGMPGASALQREAEVVFQVLEWWFLKFDLPLCTHGAPHSSPCTMAKLMAPQSQPPSTLLLSPPPALFSPCHGHIVRRHEGNDGHLDVYDGREQRPPHWLPCPHPC